MDRLMALADRLLLMALLLSQNDISSVWFRRFYYCSCWGGRERKLLVPRGTLTITAVCWKTGLIWLAYYAWLPEEVELLVSVVSLCFLWRIEYEPSSAAVQLVDGF